MERWNAGGSEGRKVSSEFPAFHIVPLTGAPACPGRPSKAPPSRLNIFSTNPAPSSILRRTPTPSPALFHPLAADRPAGELPPVNRLNYVETSIPAHHPLGTPRNRAMNPPPPTPHDDGLEWLRDIRRQIFTECGQNPDTYLDRIQALEQRPEYAPRLVRVRKVLEPVPSEQAA